MAKIFPFRAYRYNPALADPAKVLTQPYDKITPAMAEKYAAASPYNLIPIEKGKSLPSDTPVDNVSTRAANTLDEWISGKVILQDAAPSLYAYFQEYTVPGTQERLVRRGFIALGRLEDYSAGVVFRHEQTLSGPKADRLELLRRGQPVLAQSDDARLKLAFESGDADHIELVEIVRRDRQKAQTLEQRIAAIVGLGEDTLIEGKPRQLAVDEPVGRTFAHRRACRARLRFRPNRHFPLHAASL